MLQEDRFLKIVGYLKTNGAATLNELAQEVEASVGTVRRDLSCLEQSGMLQIVRGGAVAKNYDLTKQAFDMRGIEHREEKRELAEALSRIVVDGQAVALNSGTTNIEVARFLVENYYRLTVMTNNLRILNILKKAKNFTLIVPGGMFDHEEYTIYGKQCEQDILAYNIDTALLAVNALSVEKGVTDFRLREVGIIRALLQSAKQKVIVADYSKFDRLACMNVCGLNEIDCIVTDTHTGDDVIRKYEEANVNVIRAGKR